MAVQACQLKKGTKTIAMFEDVKTIDPLIVTLAFKENSIKMRRIDCQAIDYENRLIARGKPLLGE